eukprot:scaffold410710_cov20-Prasinocladus_malaysianus.AAC.1
MVLNWPVRNPSAFLTKSLAMDVRYAWCSLTAFILSRPSLRLSAPTGLSRCSDVCRSQAAPTALSNALRAKQKTR